jgi:hypothetical protein
MTGKQLSTSSRSLPFADPHQGEIELIDHCAILGIDSGNECCFLSLLSELMVHQFAGVGTSGNAHIPAC